MGLTGLSQLPPSVRRSLDRGEEPLAWETVALWGENRIGRSGPPKAVESVDLNPVSAVAGGPLEVDQGLFERWLGGIGLTGHAGSVAASLGRVLQRAGDARLAVTTQRIRVFEEGSTSFGTDHTGAKTWDAETTELWSVERSAVQSVERRSRPFMAGRLVVRFKDDSTVALMCGVLSPRAANRIRDALAR